MVDFCRSFWKGQADIVALLVTALSGHAKGKLEVTPALIKAFNTTKQLILEQVLLLASPDPDAPHDICTDAFDLQLGVVIQQQGNTAAFFLQKPSTAQLKCPAINEEMPCIVEVLKEHRPVLWGAEIDVCIDHINLTCNTIASNWIMTWRMLCEELVLSFIVLRALTMLKLMHHLGSQ